MIRYFNADIEDARRIAIVEADNADDIAETSEATHPEISPDRLPADFADWKQYTAHAYAGGTATVRVMSRDGD